jgi:hypothetical protein
VDIDPINGKFTLTNNKEGPSHIAVRLDRFLVHNNLLIQYYSFKYLILPSINSDHKIISLHFHNFLDYDPLPFWYNPLWVNNQEEVD